MFERYTEKARRVIFFARYEASQIRSPYIETEHLLLGLLREEKSAVHGLLPDLDYESVRKEVEERTDVEQMKKIATSIDLPLSNESKRVLAFAAEEADRLGHRHIGTEHLLLALLREKSPAEELLKKRGARLSELRQKVSERPWPSSAGSEAVHYYSHVAARRSAGAAALEEIDIHGQPRNADFIRRSVKKLREVSWHWQKREWTPRDVVIHRKTRALSFETNLADNKKDFELVKDGWNKDYCKICHWDLFVSKDAPDHSTGYTNGRDWLCTECYEKFIARSDFFSSNYPEIT